MFANKAINTGRQPALDYAKAIAIVGMVICHTVMYFSIGYPDNSAFCFATEVLGGPIAAPLFMICLGIGICYSHRTSPQYLLRRGVMLLLGAYLLNFVRGGGLALVGGLIFGWHPVEFNLNLDQLCFFANFNVDILQFAGLAFLFFALMVKLHVNRWLLLALAIAFPLVGHAFEGVDLGNRYLNAFAGLIIPAGSAVEGQCISFFPFTLWILYPIIGYLFGTMLQRVTDLKLFYRLMLLNMGTVTLIYIVLVLYMGPHPFSQTYFWHSLPNAFFYVCIDMTIIAACHLSVPYMSAYISNLAQFMSRNLTRIYCVSWCLIIWISFSFLILVNENGILPLWSYLVGILILIASCYLQEFEKKKEKATR